MATCFACRAKVSVVPSAVRSFTSSPRRELPRSHHGKFALLKQARVELKELAAENDDLAAVDGAQSAPEAVSRADKVLSRAREQYRQLSKLPLQPESSSHPLSAFFHEMKAVESTGDTGQPGRPYLTDELRGLNFDALHRLWYVLLKERNVLATQRDEMRRQSVPQVDNTINKQLEFRCRKSMARIKGVLNERRLAYEMAKREQLERKSEQDSVAVS